MPDAEPEQLRILVICTGNRARSQMTPGWLRHLGGVGVRVDSAGAQPKGVHPLAIAAMRKVGVDIADQTSDHVDRYAGGEYARDLLAQTLTQPARRSA